MLQITKDINPQIQNALQTPSKINTKKIIPKYIRVRCT